MVTVWKLLCGANTKGYRTWFISKLYFVDKDNFNISDLFPIENKLMSFKKTPSW